MRHRELTQVVDDVLGPVEGRLLLSELVLGALGDRTGAAALADGVEPRVVWHALCDALGVPESARWGTDAHRQAPPRNAGR
ncbi:DUF3046 domain-containing protein [Cellulomonas wangsupingiae]|uniref:DUF3046 domain-containing protein n=1 Tax=Cellulomonas wangsupingiae TaxID=2968085 RepID=A0ABY5K8K7_9CELL|nr:DUF3046 domain-containing protein [Cellulomonas wangsupingiae]MCC2335247.1 DUF3046 domain-containing protein [Cellulomonas wangsupingiae]MCM0639133.1 DUF3046 domain-containing protein [Cellulomonas wangsupingiae]UUI66614.1 DUF3046 domain-containing protein [Cellulomonas wangsupingiae]